MQDVLGAKELWAKSSIEIDIKDTRNERTLYGHSLSVQKVFNKLFGTQDKPTRLLERWLLFYGLDEKAKNRFFVNSTAACLMHDIGKANSGFQDAVKGSRGAQVIRHEHLSGLILAVPEISSWLMDIESLDFKIVTSAVIGHHFKAGREECFKPLSADRKTFYVYPGAVNDMLEELSRQFDTKPCSFTLPEIWCFGQNVEGGLEEIRERLQLLLGKWSRKLCSNYEDSKLLMSIRAALVAADSAGSCYARDGFQNMDGWLADAFCEAQLLSSGYVAENIIDPRIKQLNAGKQWHGWHNFQEAVSAISDRSLMLAPCGSGKTLAAWRWIKARLDDSPTSRAIFLYPTRATATEGFKDYVAWAPETDGALVHSSSVYELEGMFENPGDSGYRKDFTTEEKLFALGYWQRKVFSATVDQFLGFMQNGYRSVCLLPLLADSVVVIDEVHSFDRPLFSALKKFLKSFKVPVLCMTASLPGQRIKELQECGMKVFPEDIKEFEDLAAITEMPRYRVQLAEGKNDLIKIALTARENGKKVLWVANTVARCQDLAEELNALCYHSRFKLEDRRMRHNEVINIFKQKDNAEIVITTQVCEMSLDLDADILITEEAPISSLIQRMGRCNRHARPGDNKLGDVYMYKPEKYAPYTDDDLHGTEEFLSAVGGETLSQAKLQELLGKYGVGEVEIERYASFLDCGAWASSREASLREESGFNVTAILDSDIERYLNLKKAKKSADGLFIQVPAKSAEYDSRVGLRPLVAPGDSYCTKLGFIKK